MTTSKTRAAALCALLATTSLASPVLAQSADIPPPVRHQVDENGVDLARGTHLYARTDITIGPDGPGGLAYTRHLSRHWRSDSYDNGLFQQGANGWSASVGGRSYTFTLSGTTYTSTDGSGATMASTSSGPTLTLPDGTRVVFGYGVLATGDTNRKLRATSIVYPTGELISLAWKSAEWCTLTPEGCVAGTEQTAVRLQSVSSSLGYRLHFNYGRANVINASHATAWKQLLSIRAINTTIDPCDPFAHACTLTQSWPTVSYSGSSVTDPIGRTSSTTTTGTSFSVRRASSATDNLIYNYGSGGTVSSVTRDGATWTYAYSVSGDTATMVVTDPLQQSRTVVSSLPVGLPTSVTDELGRTTEYQYSGAGQLTRATAPEDNYVQYVYDARGNVTQATRVAKPGSGAANIVTSATYPAGCANPVTCNQPTTTTDANGHVIEYSYNETHGELTSVKQPVAPTGVRPETRYDFSSFTTPGGTPIYRLTSISACATTASCAGNADEVKTAIAYDQVNRLPSSVTSGSGDGALSATNAMSYDNVGNLVNIDGPLLGSADSVRYRHDAAGQLLGAIGPDPDGAGSLKHRAQRIQYNLDGQPTSVERGTVNSQSDGDWASFVSIESVTSTYDANARKVADRLNGGGSVHAATQYSYDALGRLECSAARMNPATFATLPTGACSLGTEGSFGPDRIVKTHFDALGRPTMVKHAYLTPAEAHEQASYTPNGRVQTVGDGMWNISTYEYDGYDRLEKTRFPSPVVNSAVSSTTDYELLSYDSRSNVTQRRLRDGQLIGYTYDNLSRLTAKDVPNAVYAEFDMSYGYDLLGRVTTMTSSVGHPVNLAYDALGQVVSETSVFGAKAMQHDLAGRMTRLTWPDAFYVTYEHDVIGDMTAIKENGSANLATFSYDDLGRRIVLTRGNGTHTTYQYDPVSRLASLTLDLADGPYDHGVTLGYNPASQIVSRTGSNDAYAWGGHFNVNKSDALNGLNQIVTTGATSVSHDARGNTTAIGASSYQYTSENRLATSGAGLVTTYDPAGRLIEWAPPGSNQRFDYLGGMMISEMDGSTIVKRFVHGPGVDEVLVEYSGAALATKRFLHADERGSIVAWTDAAGAAIQINKYDEYGAPQSGFNGRFGYTGQVWLPEIGLSYYKARMYSPTLGRFVQTDPIGYADGMNVYDYVSGDPVNLVDPFGLEGEDCPRTDDDPDGCTFPVTGRRVRMPVGVTVSGGVDPATGDILVRGRRTPQSDQPEESTVDKAKRCASAQLGLDDLAAAGAAVSGFNILETRGKFAGATPGTSIASRGASAVFGQTRLPFRVPTIVGNPLTLSAGIRATSSVARIVGRGIPVVGWGLLAYDAAKIAQCVASDD